MSSTAGATAIRREFAIDRELRSAVWLTLLLLGCALALFLAWRRLAGALVEPPSGFALVIAAIGLASLGTILRWFGRGHRSLLPGTEYSVLSTQLMSRLPSSSQPTASRLSFVFPGIIAILLLAALTLPGTPAWGIVIAWLVLIAGETMSWLLYVRPQLITGRAALRRPLTDAAIDASADIDEPEIPPGLVQRLTRIRERDRESLHALVQAEIAAHDQLAVVHIAFCPPLAARPELTAHAMDAENVEVRIMQVETFGARIEARLPRAEDEPRSLLVEMLGSVTCPPVA